MSYADQIRHPSGALGSPQDQGPSWGRWLLVLAGAAFLFFYFAGRPGKPGLPSSSAMKPANPRGWV